MEPVADDGFTPNHEIDEVRWVSPVDVSDLLTYDRDRVLLEEAV
jgi:acyl dehydratase